MLKWWIMIKYSYNHLSSTSIWYLGCISVVNFKSLTYKIKNINIIKFVGQNLHKYIYIYILLSMKVGSIDKNLIHTIGEYEFNSPYQHDERFISTSASVL
jgi:hypothetical protein